jgi:prepilin-type N-terminal cleavage/methylation domain-containing protein
MSDMINFKQIHSSKGFTLVEMLTVIGLIAMITALGLIMSLDAFRGFSFRNDRDAAVAALQRARSQAINNICLGTGCNDGKKHGVHFETNKMVIFQGDDYDGIGRDKSNDEIINFESKSTNASTTADGNDIIFQQLSGNSEENTITLTDTASWRNTTTTINTAGRIDY